MPAINIIILGPDIFFNIFRLRSECQDYQEKSVIEINTRSKSNDD